MELPIGFNHLTITGGIRDAARRDPSKVALRISDRSVTYDALIRRFNQVANLVREGLGLQLGDHAMVISHNCIEFIELICGLSDAGVVVATPNPHLSEREIALIVADSAPRVIFVDERSAALLASSDIAGRRVIIIGKDYEHSLSTCSEQFEPSGITEWMPFSIPYTSGTTGQPKGVLLPHRSRCLTYFAMASEYGCYGPDDHFLAIAPFCHGAGLAFALSSIFFGGTCTIMAKFDPAEVIAALHTGDITGTFMVPTHFHKIFSLPEDLLNRHRGHGLISIISNAAPLPQATKLLIVDYFGEGILHETYGATETGIVTNLRPADQLRKPNCVGTPFPCTQIELRDENGRPVPAGEVGELFSRSPYLFNGYLNRPEETAEVIQAGGWASVGDMARCDTDGYYYIVDRKKDMVISGGLNIYPREIETVIERLAGIDEVSVVGRPDPEWGETLVAFIVSTSDTPPNAETVIATCQAELANYKVPRMVHYIDRLPRNTGGKILKRELRNLAQKLAAEA
ncbi:class I adenylate-forming enzyme family protein [Govanella unica]|uniref:3-methylmercaptopropionyl-CoA ligase n=1 Tax=Govanella unica TaxID=2975056 RepID=A0A9X3TZ22_9PROT|nr:class I adenylate-forming enzyme family protein [Govania unica]MDA5194428.1 acyl--CoA ligase [Govania unica]